MFGGRERERVGAVKRELREEEKFRWGKKDEVNGLKASRQVGGEARLGSQIG